MKRIIIVRHAKSSWEYKNENDFDRSLNSKGAFEAPRMAALLKQKIPNIDLFVSSPSARTMETTSIFAEYFNYDYSNIVSEYKLYLADYLTLKKFISEIDSCYNNVALVGHNPGITELVSECSGKYIYNLPPSAFVSMILPSESWKDILNKRCDIEFFEHPSFNTNR